MRRAADPGSSALGRARWIALALVGGPLALLAVTVAAPLSFDAGALTLPVGLAGLVVPVAAYRLYLTQRDRVAAAMSPEQRGAAFVRATLLALGVSEAVALSGLVVWWGSRHPAALTGIAMHLLVAGAVWPSRPRLELFLDRRPDAADRLP